jgi:hypothetical protein
MTNKKTLIIHIGQGKTGSSAIQAFLAMNCLLLKSKGFYYPEPQEFSQPYQTSSGNRHVLYDRLNERFIKSREDIEELFKEDEKVIFSGEFFTEFLSIEKNIKDLLDLTKGINLKFIVYLRRQNEFVSSLYNQRVKNHDKIDSIEKMTILNVSKIILNLLNYVDKSSIIVRPYEKGQFYGGDIYQDFLSCIGLEMTEDYVLPDKIVNPSLNYEALEYRKLANKTGLDSEDLKKKNLLNGILASYTIENNAGIPFNTVNLLSKDHQLAIIRKYENENKEIARIFLDRKDGQLFYDDLMDYVDLKTLSIEEVIKLSKYVCKKAGVKNVNDVLKYGLVFGVMSSLHKDLSKKVTRNIEQLDEFMFKKIYSLSRIPKKHSEHVINISKGMDSFIFESSSNDPWFELPNYYRVKFKKIAIKLRIDFPCKTILQVFYRDKNKPYSEGFQQSKKVDKGLSENIFIIDSKFCIKNIRIDIGNHVGIYKIYEVLVFI